MLVSVLSLSTPHGSNMFHICADGPDLMVSKQWNGILQFLKCERNAVDGWAPDDMLLQARQDIVYRETALCFAQVHCTNMHGRVLMSLQVLDVCQGTLHPRLLHSSSQVWSDSGISE